MYYWDSGVNKYAEGIPSDEERKQLFSDGYTFMVRDYTKPKDGSEPELYEIWIK